MKPRWIGRVRKVSKLSGYTKVMIGYGFITYTRHALIMMCEVQRCFVMSVKFKDVLGRYAPVMARELVRFCDVCEVQRCFGSLRSSHGPRIGKVLWYIKSPKNAPRIF